MTRFVSRSQLVRDLVLAAAVAAILAVGLSQSRGPFAFEVRVKSSLSGRAQVYYDVGSGIREEDSTIANVSSGERVYRFALPAGTYRSLRFDPSNASAVEIALSQARVVDRRGHTRWRFSPSDFAGAQQINGFLVSGDHCQFQTDPNGTDSILSVRLDQPIALYETQASLWIVALRNFGWCFLATLGLILLARFLLYSIGPRVRDVLQAAILRSRECPVRTVFAVAVCSALLSCYPVVFFGKSFVSPNIAGSAMLYPKAPFFPGYTDTDLEFPKGSDTGAMLWQNLPYSFIQSRALLRDHELPLWNRYNSAGTTLLAQGLSMFGDPLHTITILAGGAAWAWDVKFLLAKALFCFAIGLLVLRTVKHFPSALLLTASSAFLGFFSYRFDHPAFFSMCYAPWILLCWVEIARSTTSRPFIGWASGLLLASWAEINSGGVKEGYMLLCSLYGTGFLWFLINAHGSRLKKLACLIPIGVAFLLGSAPIWLSFTDTLKSSWTAYDVVPSFQIQPSLILGFFDEVFYRAFNPEGDLFNPSANFFIFVGVLAAAAGFRILVRERSFITFFLGAAIPFALVFGVIPPAIIEKIPVLKNVGHLDNTFSCALIVHAIIIAGFGFRYLNERIGRRRWTSDYLVFCLGFLALCSLYLGFSHALQRSPDGFTPLGAAVKPNLFFHIYVISLGLALLALPLLIRIGLRNRSTLRLIGPLALLCCLIFHWRFGMHLKTGWVQIDDVVVNPQVRVNLSPYSPALDWLRKVPTPSRTAGFGNTFFPGYSGISGIESITGTDPLQNIYFRDMLISGRIPLEWMWRWVVEKERWGAMVPFYNLLNVRYFLDDRNAPDIHNPNLAKVADLDLKVYENTTAWPRAFFVDKLRPYDTAAEFAAMVMERQTGPFAAIQRTDLAQEQGISPFVSQEEPSRFVGARNYSLTNNTTTFTVDAPSAGVAVLTETFLPGDFRVLVNGAAAPYFRVNHAFRAVLIPNPGTYTISYSYWPRRFTTALIMAGAGLVILAGCSTILWLRKIAL